MSYALTEIERLSYPAWCPSCGETHPERYPVAVTPETTLGCLSCAKTWTREQLAALRVDHPEHHG